MGWLLEAVGESVPGPLARGRRAVHAVCSCVQTAIRSGRVGAHDPPRWAPL